jgi:hypothetical protein
MGDSCLCSYTNAHEKAHRHDPGEDSNRVSKPGRASRQRNGCEANDHKLNTVKSRTAVLCLPVSMSHIPLSRLNILKRVGGLTVGKEAK